jgi:diguanylate cyclase (GGDEF)-like protein
MQTVIEEERQRFDRQRRRTYLIAGLLGSLMVAIDIVKLVNDPVLPLAETIIYVTNDVLLIIISLSVCWMVITRRGSLVTIERFMFIVFAAEALLFNGIVPPLLGQTLPQLWEQTVNDDIWFLLMICTLAFHLFRHRISVILVSSLYGLALAIVGGQVLVAGLQGSDVTMGLRALQVYGMGGIFLCFIYIISRYRSISQRLQIEYQLMQEWAFIDMLTGLFNRRRCEQLLQTNIEHSRCYHQPLTICLWDIDHFKQVNDTYGHEVGDQVLRQIARLAQSSIRSTDLVGRWGGEEFCLILPHTCLSEAEELVDRLRHLIKTQVRVGQQPVTASFGLVEYDTTDNLASLIRRADEALYAAKAAGRNRVVVMA